jgi:hypothetical protein
MLEGGIDTDIVSGKPVGFEIQKKQDQATLNFRKTVLEANDLASELQKGSPVLAILARQYSGRLQALAQADPECQSIEKIINSIRATLEIRPRLAEERMLHIVGPQLQSFTTEDLAASEGIPASE